jgi:hypothetical protein
MSEEKKQSSKQATIPTADEVLMPPPTAEIEYGGKKYQVKNLSIKGVFSIIRLLGNELFKIMRMKNSKDFEDYSDEEIMIHVISDLKEEAVVEIMALVLDVDKETVLKGFTVAKGLEVINIMLELEDVQQIFFQAKRMAGQMQKVNIQKQK